MEQSIIKDKSKKQVNYRLRKDIDEKIAEMAKKRGVSKTSILEDLLDYAIQAVEREEKGAGTKKESNI